MTKKLHLLLFVLISLNVSALNVYIDGKVDKCGAYLLKDGSRLNDLFKIVSVDEDAFYLGASWFHESNKIEQLALKTGILFDLGVLAKQASLNNDNSLATLAFSLSNDINSLPVTGRVIQMLDPAALIKTRLNRWLQEGDKLYFPARPTKVRIIGVIAEPCNLDFTRMQKASYYLESCKINHEYADLDYVFIIQADGNVRKEGIALWNREKTVFIAPGASIFVPIRQNLLPIDMQNLNTEIATFWATQPINEETLP